MTRRRKAGLLLAAAAVIGAVAFATNVLGAGSSAPARPDRPDAIKAQVKFTNLPSKAGKALPKTLYGGLTGSVPSGDQTLTLKKCPKKTHAINGTLAAKDPTQARYLTIRGFGITNVGKGKALNAWFIDVSNSLTDSTTGNGLPLRAVGVLVCQKG